MEKLLILLTRNILLENNRQNSHSYCSCDPAEASQVTIEVDDIVEPIATEGNLADPNNVGGLLSHYP